MNRTLAGRLFRLGAARRNPSLFQEYERVKASERLSLEDLEALQLERAFSFFSFVGEHSRYYSRLFQKHGFVPSRFQSLDQLHRLPILEKSDLLRHNDAIHTQYPFNRTFVAETSGTTGESLSFRRNELWDSTNRAYLMRSYDWYGVKPWDRNGYLWGYDIRPVDALKTKFLDALQNRFRLFSYDNEALLRFARRLKSATFLTGYSSMIYQVARLNQELGLPELRLRLVKGTSEMIMPAYQEPVARAFGTRMVSEYGAAEAGLIAFECPHGGSHINLEDVIVEISDDGDILVTNLASWSFPIIRYRLGDHVRLSESTCSCGRAHPMIGEVVGRKGAIIHGERQTYPALTFYYVFKNIALKHNLILNYKAVQEEAGRVILSVEGMDNRLHADHIETELQHYFGDDVTVTLRFVPSFEPHKRKTQYFESRLEAS